MKTNNKTEDLVRLYQLFGHSIRENDAGAVRQFYRELRNAGQPLQEILEEAAANAAAIERLERHLLEDNDSFGPQPAVTAKLIHNAPIAVGEAQAKSKSADLEEVCSAADAAPVRALARMFQTTAQSRLIWLTSGMAISGIGCFVFLSFMPVQFGRDPAMPSRGTPVMIAEKPNAQADRGQSSTATGSRRASLVIEHSPPDAVVMLTEPTSEPEAQQTTVEKVVSAQLEPKIEPRDKDPSLSASTSERPLSNAEKLELLNRGDALFAIGDLSAARQFYERAAEAGYGEAAVRLGESYDPAFLQQAGLRGVLSDVTAAKLWYRRAVQLGVQEAEILLQAIQTD